MNTDYFYQIKASVSSIVDGKRTTEQVLVKAPTFGSAETTAVAEFSEYYMDIDISAVTRTAYEEIVNQEADDGKYFKVKLNFTTINEKNGKEKIASRLILVRAASTLDAHKLTTEHMKTSVMDYEVAKIEETPIIDVYTAQSENEDEP